MDRVYEDRYGVRRTLIIDPDRPYSPIVRTEFDVEPVLDSVHRDRELMPNNGVNKVVARVPMTIVERSIHEQWDKDDWKRWLNSSEAEPFRIWRGSV